MRVGSSEHLLYLCFRNSRKLMAETVRLKHSATSAACVDNHLELERNTCVWMAIGDPAIEKEAYWPLVCGIAWGVIYFHLIWTQHSFLMKFMHQGLEEH